MEIFGVKYLFISIEFGADDNVLNWANEVLPQYPDHRVVMFTHGYLTTSGERMVAGDNHCPSGYGYASKVQVNKNKNTITALKTNVLMVFSCSPTRTKKPIFAYIEVFLICTDFH